MNLVVMILLLAVFLGLITVAWRKTRPEEGGQAMTLRMGELVETDGAFEAWTSGDLDQMVDALDLPTNPIDRHFLLQNIVEKTYRERDNPKARHLCLRVAEMHLTEFPEIAPALKKDMGGFLPRVSTFQHYATVLTEDGEFDRAVEVCEQAMEHGLHDRAKTGLRGEPNGFVGRRREFETGVRVYRRS